MRQGLFCVARKLWVDPDFEDEPFSEREAFLWLVGEAAWRPYRKRVGRGSVALDRGQCCHSIRFLAERWRWSKSRVHRFLERLQKRGILALRAGRSAGHSAGQ